MDSKESTPSQSAEGTEQKKDKGVSKATAQKLLAKYKALQVCNTCAILICNKNRVSTNR